MKTYKKDQSFNDLKGSLTESDIDELVAILGKHCGPRTRNTIRSILRYQTGGIPLYGCFERLIKESYGWVYCAGQSYVDEVRNIRGLLCR